ATRPGGAAPVSYPPHGSLLPSRRVSGGSSRGLFPQPRVIRSISLNRGRVSAPTLEHDRVQARKFPAAAVARRRKVQQGVHLWQPRLEFLLSAAQSARGTT